MMADDSPAEIRLDSPFGPLIVEEEGRAITAVRWGAHPVESAAAPVQTPLLQEAAAQIGAYFEGRLQRFDLPLAPQGSAFQLRLYDELKAIPYGETRRYGELGVRLGVPGRGIGQSCGANPIQILFPCHRVLGANGLGGYSGAGGIETKVALLRLEGAAGLLI